MSANFEKTRVDNYFETKKALSLLQGLSLTVALDSSTCSALAEAGVVYAELETFYSSHHYGVVRQALASALRSQLDLYLRDLATIEAEIARNEKQTNEDNATITLWTIRRLSAWLVKTIARLRALQRIIRSTDSCTGVHITTSVWGCCMTGDPQVKEVAAVMFAAVARPFGLACRNWIRGTAPTGVPLLRSSSSSSSTSTDDFFVREKPLTLSLSNMTLNSKEEVVEEEEVDNYQDNNEDNVLYHQNTTPPFRKRKSLGLWGHYTIDMRLVPSFLNAELAVEIFDCGRTLRFLQQVCGDELWVASLGRKLREGDELTAQTLRSSTPSSIVTSSLSMAVGIGKEKEKSSSSFSSSSSSSSSVSQENSNSFSPTSLQNALQEAHILGPIGSQRLLQLLRDKFGLLQHLAAVHRYIFLTQGDFVTSLVASISSELSRPAALMSASKHVLDGIFETAVRATNAHLDDRSVLDRVLVTLLPLSTITKMSSFDSRSSSSYSSSSSSSTSAKLKGNNVSGWDVFCLEYAVDEPISSIVDSSCQVRCGAIFSFLWLLRRCEHELTKAWREQAEVHHFIRGSPDSRVLIEALHRSHLLRSEIASFVKTLLSHAMFDVLAPAWTRLHQDVENATGMDDLIVAYGTYLDGIVEGLFLHQETSTTFASTTISLNGIQDTVFPGAETRASRAISRILRIALDYTEIQRRQSLLILSAVESKPVTLEEGDSTAGSKGKRSKRIVSAVADVKVLAEALVSHAEALESISINFRQAVKELFSLIITNEINISIAERLEAIQARYDSR